MKYSKLIPIATIASIPAVVVPLATSCGTSMSYTNMLNQYVPGVKSYPKTTIKGTGPAAKLYEKRVQRNPDVIRDDVLYSWSSAFNTQASRQAIDNLFTVTRYHLNIFVDDIVAESETVKFNFSFWASISGQTKTTTLELDEHNVTNFSFDINFSSQQFKEPAFAYKQAGEKPLAELYPIYMELGVCEIAINGSYDYDDSGTKGTVNDYSAHDIFDVEVGDKPESWDVVNDFVLQVPRVAYLDDPSERATDFVFMGNYFKNVTIE